uniref:Major capsid protein L1 n=1 Tax=Pipistrellus kuhlii papillomavirus TaxID=3140005 RepID=A0AAU6S5C2_9PAPI
MAVWLPAANKFYLPPQPITRVLNTEEYVQRTNIFYHAGSERLLTVGHPFYDIVNAAGNVTIPKVSGNQYRVFRIRFPDPNNFAFNDSSVFNPETERLVWAVRGLEVNRGQPLGISLSGHAYFNKLADAENAFNYENSMGTAQQNERENVAFDVKQVQMFMVGCKPQSGEYWDKAPVCADQDPAPAPGDCPPIELETKFIEDGDMVEIGFGNLNFKALQQNRADAPLDTLNNTAVYPDFIKMAEEPFGDSLFFYARREQMYARHFFTRDGLNAEAIPDSFYYKAAEGANKSPISTDMYGFTPSGSLVSSEAQLFNRPYWLQRAQGQNNGVIWNNELFLSVVDNTRGTIFSINQSTEPLTEWDPSKIKEYLRHVEEYQLSFIIQLCKVKLTPENLAFIHTMNPDIIENWHLAVNPPPGSSIEDHYRYLSSLATKCPDSVQPTERPDPYKDLRFWEVDLRERMTEQLDQTPLGRKFLFQTGIRPKGQGKSVVAPRLRKTAKRRKTSKSS